jgi:hypothetical protein
LKVLPSLGFQCYGNSKPSKLNPNASSQVNPNAQVVFISQTLRMDVSGKKHKEAEGRRHIGRWEEGQKEGGKWVGGKKGSR